MIETKLYVGFRDGDRAGSPRRVLKIFADGTSAPLGSRESFSSRMHMRSASDLPTPPPRGEDPFDWGSAGFTDGPARLALAILADALDETAAVEGFVRMVGGWIAGLDDDAWILAAEDVRTWWARSVAEEATGRLDDHKLAGVRPQEGGAP